MVKDSEKVGVGVALAAFILNMMLPGLGSLIAKKTSEGVLQLVVYIIGAILVVLTVGFFGIIMLAVWIWALVTSIQTLKEADNN